jgi:hypothetical protein
MRSFKILMYEDNLEWKDGFEFAIRPKLERSGIQLHIYHKYDNATLMQDIEVIPHLILIDFDLGHITGEEIIQQIDGDPQFNSTSIFFYSGGESIDSLKAISGKFNCGVSCFNKKGDDLENAVISKGESI